MPFDGVITQPPAGAVSRAARHASQVSGHEPSITNDQYLESAGQIYAALPADWRMFLEHKICEPAFYATVIQDWGSSFIAASTLGPKAQCLVDLGHHAPNVNIELIVARLIASGKLAGFHFNDSKYGDDDLDAGSVAPYRLFLVFNELVAAAHEGVSGFNPSYMLDQSHNVSHVLRSLIEANVFSQIGSQALPRSGAQTAMLNGTARQLEPAARATIAAVHAARETIRCVRSQD